MNQNNIVPILN